MYTTNPTRVFHPCEIVHSLMKLILEYSVHNQPHQSVSSLYNCTQFNIVNNRVVYTNNPTRVFQPGTIVQSLIKLILEYIVHNQPHQSVPSLYNCTKFNEVNIEVQCIQPTSPAYFIPVQCKMYVHI